MGRDHGIPSYTVWRSQCGLRRPDTFGDLAQDVRDPATLEQLSRLYRSVHDVDLVILGLAEKPLKGSMVGPTFACIIAKQFQKVCLFAPSRSPHPLHCLVVAAARRPLLVRELLLPLRLHRRFHRLSYHSGSRGRKKGV